MAATARRSLAPLFVVVAVSITGNQQPTLAAGSYRSLNITNNCRYTVWPGILSGAAVAGSAAALDSTGFELAPGQSRAMRVPSGWSGDLWGRTLCSADITTAKFTCVTGDCGSGKQDCDGGGPAPPVTLAQFTLDGSGGMDLYDVSLVDGYNVPMLVAPQDGVGGTCAPTGCVGDLNVACPAELRVASPSADGTGGAVACKSACLAFGSPQYCCTGAYGDPDTCKPSAYSELFKKTCPRAFSYAYDSAGSIFTCGGGDISTYTITFCPSTSTTTTSGKPFSSPNLQPQETGNLPHIDSTTPYTGGSQAPTAASTPWRIALVVGVLGVVTAALSVLATALGLCKPCCSRSD